MMTNEPGISVIVPVYNGNRFLGEALESVLQQSRAATEIIVVDDGSPDPPDPVLGEYRKHVILLRTENRGPASARNYGIEHSNGDLISFIDQDDRWHRDKLNRQYNCFLEEPDLDACYSCADFFWEPGLEDEAVRYANHQRTRSVPAYVAPAMLAKRSAFTTIGAFDPELRFGDGSEWAMRALDGGLRVRLVNDVLLYHRMHLDNLTRSREQSKKEFVGIVRKRLHRGRINSQAFVSRS